MRWLWWLWPDMPERIVMLLALRYVPFFVLGMLAHRVWSGQRRLMQQVPVALLAILSIAIVDTVDIVAMGLLMVALFVAMIHGRLRFLALRPLVWMGGISYSFYLIHQHIGFVVMLEMARAGYSPWVAFFAAFLIALTLGTVINRLVERPAAEAILAWWKGRRRGAAASFGSGLAH